MMPEPARVNDAGQFTEDVCLSVDWLVRRLAPVVLAAAGRTDDAADLDQLPELTAAMFGWPGLLDRAGRILTAAAAALLEAFLAEHRANSRELTESEYEVLCDGIGAEALEIADAARISVLPHLIGQHAYRAVAVGVQLLHFRHGPAGSVMTALRDQAVTGVVELEEQLMELVAEQQERNLAAAEGRTCRQLPVWTPQPRLGA